MYGRAFLLLSLNHATMAISFHDLGLRRTLVDTVADRGYTHPTPIQAKLIPSLLQGRDAIGQAHTGTGKTAAFALPMLHHLEQGTGVLRGLVLCPTRELARQVSQAIYEYGKTSGIRVLAVYGGQPYGRQISRLKKGVDVVVGTPGRMLDLIQKGILDLRQVTSAVLDEADEMLSMGFIDDIESILSATPDSRQTAFFSATMSKRFERLASRHLDNPETCRLDAGDRTASTIDQRAHVVAKKDRLDALLRLLDVEAIDSAIVFARTRNDTFQLASALRRHGVAADALNGEMDQPERRRVLARFTDRSIKVLVGTNVAARGLDIDHVTHVFNYDLPDDPEVYVHRVGRTGRAGTSGTAISLVPSNQRSKMKSIERYTKVKVTWAPLPTEADARDIRDEQLRSNVEEWMEGSNYDRERDIAQTLLDEGHSPADVIASVLKAYRDKEEQPSGAAARLRGARPPKPSHEDGMVRLTLSTGTSSGTRPGQVVGTLASNTSMSGSVIGKIRIGNRQTTVDVPSEYADEIIANSGRFKIGRQRIHVEA